jgi:hypothetical protein
VGNCIAGKLRSLAVHCMARCSTAQMQYFSHRIAYRRQSFTCSPVYTFCGYLCAFRTFDQAESRVEEHTINRAAWLIQGQLLFCCVQGSWAAKDYLTHAAQG